MSAECPECGGGDIAVTETRILRAKVQLCWEEGVGFYDGNDLDEELVDTEKADDAECQDCGFTGDPEDFIPPDDGPDPDVQRDEAADREFYGQEDPCD